MEEMSANKKISFKQMLKISLFAFKMYIKPDKVSGVFLFLLEIIIRLSGMVDFLIIAKIIDVVVNILQSQGSIEKTIPYLLFLAIFNFIVSLLGRTR